MKKFRLFFNSIEGRKKWLNHIAKEGYCLQSIRGKGIMYEFVESDKPYEYAVQYIGYMSNKERIEYQSLLKDLGYHYWNVAINVGQISYGRMKWRPYADLQGQIATSPGMINREILVIEKRADQKPFQLFSDNQSSILDLKRRRRSYIYLAVFSLVFMGMSYSSWQSYHLTGWSYRPEMSKVLLGAVLGLLLLYSTYFVIFLSKEIGRLQEK